jgi:hypothetical protein
MDKEDLIKFLDLVEVEKYTIKRGRNLLDSYGGEDWKMKIDSRTKSWRIGQCRGTCREVGISEWWLKELVADAVSDVKMAVIKMRERINDVLCHEIAHIGPYGHTLDWKRQYASLLWEVFGSEWTVQQLLKGDRYCKDDVDRLMRETEGKSFKPFVQKNAAAAAFESN